MLAAIFSALHVLALGIGLGAVWLRGRALRARRWDAEAVQRVLSADNVWGLAALLWIATGLIRLLAGLDKATPYYVYNGFFWLKMGAFVLLFALEIGPMVTFIRWRVARSQGVAADTSRVATWIRVNDAEVGLVILIPFLAAMMARGVWLFG